MRCTFVKTILQVGDNGFCICKYSTKDEAVPNEARDKYASAGVIQFTATGYSYRIPIHKLWILESKVV